MPYQFLEEKMAKKAKKATKKVAAKGTKKATVKAAPKKATKKVVAVAKAKTTKTKAVKAKTKRKPNAAFMKALTPSSALAAIVGATALPRTQAVKKIWEYIKKHKLQNPNNKRNILADDSLKTLFGGKKEITMFELTSIVSKHLN
jgi:chromatin remodeling complex protein RSC6